MFYRIFAVRYLLASLLFLPALSGHAVETEDKFTPSGQVSATTADGVLIRGSVYNFAGQRKNPITLLVVPPYGTSSRVASFFLNEVKHMPWTIIFADLRGQGLSQNKAPDQKLSWRTFDKEQYKKLPDDLVLLAHATGTGPLFVMGFELTATVSVIAASSLQPTGLILFSPLDEIRELKADPSMIDSKTSVFAAAGSESATHFAILEKWQSSLASDHSESQIYLQSGLGNGFSLFNSSTALRKKLWKWIADRAKRPVQRSK